MNHRTISELAMAASPPILAASAALAADAPNVDPAELDKAFETLKTFNWGSDPKTLQAIDRAVIATQTDAAGRKTLEDRLTQVLGTGISRAAKDYVCRTLRTVGTADSVKVLATLLPNDEFSHMARYALERAPATEAGAVLRDALSKVGGTLKAGMAGSLGARRDAAATSTLIGPLRDSNATTVIAAATALGAIGTPEAVRALRDAVTKAPAAAKPAVIDACFRCAEQLMGGGKKAEALAIYKSFAGEDQAGHVRLAATRGLLGQ